MAVICPRCGAKVKPGGICPRCGANLGVHSKKIRKSWGLPRVVAVALILTFLAGLCVFFEISTAKSREEVGKLEARANELIEKGNYKKACRLLEKGITNGQRSEKIYLMLGDSYENLGDEDKAIDAYERGRKVFKRSKQLAQAEVEICLRRMNQAYDNADYQSAIEQATMILGIDKNNNEAKRVYSDCLEVFSSFSGDGDSAGGDGVEYEGGILSQSSIRYLKEEDLKGLSKKELRLARNEIYARHGRRYTEEELLSFFEQFDWYQPDTDGEDFSDDVLNSYERYNAEFILAYEKKQGYVK